MNKKNVSVLSRLFAFIHSEDRLNMKMFFVYTVIVTGVVSLYRFQLEAVFPFICAWLTADFISGLMHIYLDKSAIKHDGSFLDSQRLGFQFHHEKPSGKFEDPHYNPLTEMNYVYPYTILIALLGLLVSLDFLRWFILFNALFFSLLQAAHLYAHARSAGRKIPWLVSISQDAGVILSPQHHNIHHSGDHDVNFAILNGSSNFILNYCWKRCRNGRFVRRLLQ